MSATLLAQSAGMRAQEGDGDLARPLDDDQAFIHVGKEGGEEREREGNSLVPSPFLLAVI